MNNNRIAVMSDAHGNVSSLKRAFQIAEDHHTRSIIYLGDAIGYFPSLEALDFLMENRDSIKFVRGNHEDQVLNMNNFGSSKDVKKHKVIKSMMTSSQRDFISQWPKSLSFEEGEKRILCVHGTPYDPINGYLYEDTPISFSDEIKGYDIIFLGNTHIPFLRRFESALIVNVGSVGMPRDNGSSASMAILDFEEGNVKVIRFDIGDLQERIRQEFGHSIHSDVYELMRRTSLRKQIEEMKID